MAAQDIEYVGRLLAEGVTVPGDYRDCAGRVRGIHDHASRLEGRDGAGPMVTGQPAAGSGQAVGRGDLMLRPDGSRPLRRAATGAALPQPHDDAGAVRTGLGRARQALAETPRHTDDQIASLPEPGNDRPGITRPRPGRTMRRARSAATSWALEQGRNREG
jgi:hypothetical protein